MTLGVGLANGPVGVGASGLVGAGGLDDGGTSNGDTFFFLCLC